MTTPTQFLIQEPCLEYRTIGVGDPREVAKDGYLEWPAVPGRKCGERCETMGMFVEKA
jgi:hypothetical protein